MTSKLATAVAACAATLTLVGVGSYGYAQFDNPTASEPAEFVAIDTYRAIDTRLGQDVDDITKRPGKLSGEDEGTGFFYLLDVGSDLDGNQMIPEKAVAVSYNVSAAGTENSGFASIGGIGTISETSSVLSWTGDGQRVVNSGNTATFDRFEMTTGDELVVAEVGGDGVVAADLIIDVTGYYVPAD